MFKKKFSIVVITLLFLISMIMPIVKADNETDTNTTNATAETTNTNAQVDTTSTSENESVTNTSQDISMKEGDVFIFQNDVTIDYLVDGNVFIFGKNVTIDSQIGGDVFVYSNDLTVTENGYILGNVFAISTNITIKGIAYDLYASSDNVTIDGYVGRDIKVISNTLSINGVVGRNAFVRTDNIKFPDSNANEGESATTGYIAGSLNYSAPNELSIPDKSVVGDVSYSPISTGSSSSASIETYLISLGSTLVLVIVIWLIGLKLTPKFLNNTTNYISSKKILPVILAGILTPIVLFIVSILLLFISITVPIGLLMLLALFMIAWIGTSITIISINNLVCDKLKVNKTVGRFGILILTTIILWAICLIPYVGGIISLAFIIVGMGLITYNLLTLNRADKKVESKDDKDSKKAKNNNSDTKKDNKDTKKAENNINTDNDKKDK